MKYKHREQLIIKSVSLTIHASERIKERLGFSLNHGEISVILIGKPATYIQTKDVWLYEYGKIRCYLQKHRAANTFRVITVVKL